MQAILEPGTSDPNMDPNEAVVIEVTASNVSISGLTIDGSNPGLMHYQSNVADVTALGMTTPIDAAEGIVSYRGVGSISVEHNIIQNLGTPALTSTTTTTPAWPPRPTRFPPT